MSRAAGWLLTVPFGLTLVFILIVGVVERRNIFRPDAEDIADHVLTTRIGHVSGIVGLVSMLAGFAFLTSLLRQSGSDIAAIAGFVLIAVMVGLFLLDLTVRTSVGVWAAIETVADGSEPEAWSIVVKWINTNMNVYIAAGFTAFAIYGVAILQTGLLPSWLGWLAIGWSAAWLLLATVMGGGIPGTLPIMPFIFGLALLIGGT